MNGVLAGLAVVLGWGFGLRADPPAIFTDTSFQAALDESKRTKRLLLVYPRGRGPGFAEMEATTWRSPTLRDWVLWHAIAVRVDRADDPEDFRRVRSLARGTGLPVGEKPLVLVFKDGRLYRTIPDHRFQMFFYEPSRILNANDPDAQPDASVFYPKTLHVLLLLDMCMDGLRTLDPAWMAAHEQRNPMPPAPPPPEPLCRTADEGAPAFEDPPPGEGGEVDVLRVLDEAREDVRTGALHDATGRLTWLWERAASVEPAFAPARVWLIADAMTDAASRREASRERFTVLRDRLGERQPWWTFGDVHDWIVLNRVVADPLASLDLFSMHMVDEQEASLVLPAERAAYRVLTGAGGPSDPAMAPDRALVWLRDQERYVRAGRPDEIDDRQWAELRSLRTRMIVERACRLYAECIGAGDPATASAAMDAALRAQDDATTRVALVMTALAFGRCDRASGHRLLDEAAARGDTIARAGLRRRLDQTP